MYTISLSLSKKGGSLLQIMTSSYSILFYVPSNKRISNIDAPSVLAGKALHIYPVIRLSVPEVPVLGSQGYLPGIELVLPLSTPPMKGRYLSLPRSRNSSSLYLFLRILYIHKLLRRESSVGPLGVGLAAARRGSGTIRIAWKGRYSAKRHQDWIHFARSYPAHMPSPPSPSYNLKQVRSRDCFSVDWRRDGK